MSDVRWEGFTHAEIYAQVRQGPGRAASADAEAAWTTVGETIRAVNDQLARAVRQIGVEWEGPAADAAHGGMSAMHSWALDAADNATLTTDGIAAQAAGAQHVRDAMPPPRQELDTAVALAGAGGYAPRATDVGAIEDQMAEDRALAVDLMNRYTSDSSTHQEMMNYWTQPPAVVVEAVAPPTSARTRVRAVRGSGTGLAPAAIAPADGRTVVPDGRPGTAGPGAADDGAGPGAGATAGAGRAGPAPPVSTPWTGSGVPTPSGLPPPGAGTGGPGVPTSRGRPSGDEPPTGGPRRIVPGVPARPGVLDAPGGRDAPWRAPAAWPGGGVTSGGRGGVVEPDAPRAGPGGPAQDAVAGRPAGGPPERLGAGGPGAPEGGRGILPLGGAVGRASPQEHRRAGYLLDDTDAFADDRWFTPPVIGADEPGVTRA